MSTVITYDLVKKPNKITFGTVVINRIDNPLDPINSKVTRTDIHGQSLDKYLDGYCLGIEYKVVVNGKFIDQPFEEYIVKPNDNISYTPILAGGGGGGGKQIMTMVAMIALAVVAPYAAGFLVTGSWVSAAGLVGMQYAAGMALTVGIMYAGGLLINSFINSGTPSITSTAPETESQTYSWSGIQTSRDLNKPIPVLYGTHALGGTVINSRFYYSGSDDWIGTQLSLCQGEIEDITSDNIKINDVEYSSFITQGDTSNGFFQTRRGTFDQSIMTGYGDSNFNNGTVSRELKYNVPYTFETTSTNINYFRLHFEFPSGLYSIDTSNGKKLTKTVQIQAKYRVKGTTTWYDIYDINPQAVKEYQYTYKKRITIGLSEFWIPLELWTDDDNAVVIPEGVIKDFTKTGAYRYGNVIGSDSTNLTFSSQSSVALKRYYEPLDQLARPINLEDAQYEFMVTRITPDDSIDDNYNKSNSFVRFVEEINTTDVNYGGIALLGIDLKATDQLSNSRPNFKVTCTRRPLLIGSTYYESDNPAWICLDILTNKSYGMGLDISEIDIPSFNRWANFCNGGIANTFTLDRMLIPSVLFYYTKNNNILIPATDLPENEIIKNLSQLKLNLSSLSATGYYTVNNIDYAVTLGIQDIVGIEYKYISKDDIINDGYYYSLKMSHNIKQDEPIQYSLTFNSSAYVLSPRLVFNGLFDTAGDVWTAVQDTAQIGRGQVVLRGNRYSCIFDDIKTVKGLYNAANSKNVTIQYISNADIASEIEVQFSDSNIAYEMNSISVQDIDTMSSNIRSNKTTKQVKGITSEADALIYGKYLLSTSKFIRRIVTLDADIESITQTIGDLIAVQTDVTQYGIGGLVEKVVGRFVTLDNVVYLEKGKTYTIKLKNHLTDDIREFTFVAETMTKELTYDDMGNTYVGDLTFDDFTLKISFESEDYIEAQVISVDGAFDINVGDRYTFGVQGSDSILCTITSIDRNGELSRKITAVEYNASILDFDYDNDMLQRILPTGKPKNEITDFNASDRLVKLDVGQVVAMISFGWTGKISSYYNIYILEEGGFKHYLGNNIKETRYEYPNTVLIPEQMYTIYIEDVQDMSIISSMNYTVTAFSTPPENISGVTLTPRGTNLEFRISYPNKPLDFAYYNIYKNETLISTQVSDIFELKYTRGESLTIYNIEAVDLIKKKSVDRYDVNFVPQMPIITNVDYVLDGDNIKFNILANKGSFDITSYEVKYDTNILSSKDSYPIIKANFMGDKEFQIQAFDTLGNVSNTFNLTVSVQVPTPTNLKAIIDGKDVVINWDAPKSDISIDYFELIYDSVIVQVKNNSYRVPISWGGSMEFNVCTVNSLGAKSLNMNVTITIVSGDVINFQAEVIDNNVLLRWKGVQGSLPINTYKIYKGIDENNLIFIGEKSGTFTTVFENESGVYTYWISAIDTAGNEGVLNNITTKVSEPPDYVLNVNWISDFTGTKHNAQAGDKGLIIPINSTETYEEHFINNGWNTAQEQITSGNPLWIQPFLNDGYYEEEFDYGTILPSSLITISLDTTIIIGSPNISTTLSISSDGSTWMDYINQTQVYGIGFRYIKIRIDVTGNSEGLYITNLALKLDSKIKNDSGNGYSSIPLHTQSIIGNGVYATLTFNNQSVNPFKIGQTIELTDVIPSSWNGTYIVRSCTPDTVTILTTNTTSVSTQGYLDKNGTIILFNKEFVDITSIGVTPNSTIPIISIYDFEDIPNPLYFKVLLYDTNGNRVSGNFSWSVKGY